MNASDRPSVFPRPLARYELDRGGGGVTGCNNNNRCLRPTSICQIRFSENGKRKKKAFFDRWAKGIYFVVRDKPSGNQVNEPWDFFWN